MFSEMFLVHSSKNEYGVHGTTARHETILYLIDIKKKKKSYDAFYDTLNELHNVVQQF